MVSDIITTHLPAVDKRPLKMKKVESIKHTRPTPTRPILPNPRKT